MSIEGYRAWSTIEDTSGKLVLLLSSTGVSSVWSANAEGVCRAVCRINDTHHGRRCNPSPGPKCLCGIHAFKSLSLLIREFPGAEPVVYGKVTLWGRVQEHEDGYRAEYARVESLYVHERSRVSELDILRLADRYKAKIETWPEGVEAATYPDDVYRAQVTKVRSYQRPMTIEELEAIMACESVSLAFRQFAYKQWKTKLKARLRAAQAKRVKHLSYVASYVDPLIAGLVAKLQSQKEI